MNNFFKKIIFVFTLSLSFFVFSGEKAEACEISSFNARPPGWFTINEYSDETPPYIYFDVQTQNCDTQAGNVLNFVIQNIDLDIIGGPSIDVYDIQNIRVRIKQAGSTSSQGGFVNFETTNSNFTIPLIVGEDGNLGSCDGLAGFDDCQLFLKIYNTSAPGSPQIFAVDSAGLGIQYDCDILCNEDWRLGCPQGAGVPPNVLEYGAPNICSTDTGTIDITTHPTGVTGTPTSVISDNYSTEPLAPLPGFAGNPNLGQWFESLFTLLIVIAGILALIMIVVGGITYVTSESFGGKGKGKEYIINAIIGLVLALGAWVILNTINPNLAEDLNLTIPTQTLSIGDADYWSGSAQTDQSGTITANSPLPDIGLVCPMGGGPSSIPGIIDSFAGKTTYRWGGKGGPLPQGGQFKLSPGEQANGPYMCQGPNGSVPCRSFCPDNSVCLDCSGFVNQVRRCSGLPTFSGTSSMVNDPAAIAIESNNISSNGQSVTINGASYNFVPGDILVWNGHVVIYYGDGKIAESAGAVTTNTNIKISNLSSYSGKNRITHLIKVNP